MCYASDYYYYYCYYYAAFNAPCVGHKDDEPQAQFYIRRYSHFLCTICSVCHTLTCRVFCGEFLNGFACIYERTISIQLS